MMQRHVIFAAVCVAFLLAGIGAGMHGRNKAVILSSGESSVAKSASRSGIVTPAGITVSRPDGDQELRAILTRCETRVLWDWLAANAEREDRDFTSVLQELIDRLGWQAFDHALGIEDAKLRSLLSGKILGLFALKDPWKAFEIFRQHRDEFADPEWGRFALEGCIFAAAGFSADKMLEVFAEMPSEESTVFMIAAYGPNFDFRKTLDFLVTTETPPTSVPENLISEWVKRSPLEASEWLAGHPEYLDGELMLRQGRLLLENLAACANPEEREKALEAAGALPAPFLDQAWSEIGEQQDGKLEPDLLAAAERLGRREEFLTAALLATNTSEKLDASWRTIPADERMTLLQAAEEKWLHHVDTPFSRRALEGWRQMVIEGWDARD